MNRTPFAHIIWDWNGTLLNDAWLCVEVMNGMLRKRKLPSITLPIYRSLFTFPVKEYYSKLGFDFDREPFEKVGMEFVYLYNQRQHECQLHESATETLSCIAGTGIRQHILSAREQQELRAETQQLQVGDYFDLVRGLDDHYAHGKTEAGFRLLQDLAVPADTILFIGDTLHDAEVARELGIACLLVANGHHAFTRLQTSGIPVYKSLSDLTPLVCPSV